MTRTIDLADVVTPDVWESGSRWREQNAYTADSREYVSAYEGLSSFNIPTKIEFTPKAGHVVIRFSYPDAEPGGKPPEPVPGRTDLWVSLGIHTKKIVEITVHNLHKFLVLERGGLPEDAIASLAAEYPSRIQKVLTRNARLISGLFASLSEPDRTRILQMLARDTKVGHDG